jgi:hypothetical protein
LAELVQRYLARLQPSGEALLTVYLRVLAVAFLAAGITHWIRLLVLPASPTGSLTRLPLADRVETIAFAVLDPIAAVGLWLTAAWGIVVWLIKAVSRMVLSSGFARGSELDLVQLVVQVASIVIYLGLSQLVRRANARRELEEES